MEVIKRLYQFIFRTPQPFVFGTILMVIGMGLNNASPFFVKWLTENIQAGRVQETFWLIVLLGVSLVVSNIFENVAYFITDKNMVKTSTTISQMVLTHIHNLDFAYHTNKSSGKLISMMKRGDEAFFTYYDILNRQILNMIVSFVIMFGAFSQLRLHYIFFVLIIMLISVVISRQLVKINIARRKEFNKADDEVSSVRVDNLVNFDTVKYFANEKYEQNRFGKLLQRWYDTLQAYFFTFRYFDGIIGNLTNVALVGIMIIALRDLQTGAIGLPDFLLVTTFSMTLFPRMMSMLYSMRELAKKFTDLHDYFGLLDESISVEDPAIAQHITQPKGEVIFDNVSFGYDRYHQPILKDFNLHIKHGESIAFVGYSGAGKTTIAKLMMRMYDPQVGEIRVDGVNIKELTKAELRKIIGVVPQDPLLFNNTVYYNIAYAKDNATKEEVVAAAKAARVDDFVKKLPKGYDTVVGERGIKLSGGQRQRLAISRVLLEQPQILVFDEATSALDSASEQMIQAAFWNLVRDPKNPRTSIIIAHRLSTIMKADRIVVMDKGKIVDIGSHEQLIKKKTGIYHQLWSLQRNGFIGDEETEV